MNHWTPIPHLAVDGGESFAALVVTAMIYFGILVVLGIIAQALGWTPDTRDAQQRQADRDRKRQDEAGR